MTGTGNAGAPGSLLGRAVTNSLYTSVGTAGNFIVSFLFAGLTIRFLGEARAGYLMAVQAFLGLNAIFGDFGLGSSAVRRVAELSQAGDFEKARKVIGTVLTVMVSTALVLVLAGVVSFPWIFGWSKLNAQFEAEARWATYLVLLQFLLAQVSGSWGAAFQGLQRYDLIAFLNTSFGLLAGISGMVVLSTMPSLVAVTASNAAVAVLKIGAELIFVKRNLGGLPSPGIEKVELKPMLRFGGWVYLTNLGGQFFLNADRLVLTTFLGSASLPYYVMPQRIYYQVMNVMGSQLGFLFPMLSSYGDDAAREIARVEDRMRWFTGMAGAVLFTGVALMGPLVLSFVVGAEFAAKATIPLYLACVQGFFHTQSIVPHLCNWAVGQSRPNAIVQLVQGCSVLLSGLALIPAAGYIGASVAQLWIIPVTVWINIWMRSIIMPDKPKMGWMGTLCSPLLTSSVWLAVSTLGAMATGGGLAWQVGWFFAGGAAGVAAGYACERAFFPEMRRWDTMFRALEMARGKSRLIPRVFGPRP